MDAVHATIEIEAPVERVWETIMDPEQLGNWVTIHRSVDNVSEPLQQQGATMEQTLHMRGVSFCVKWKLAEVEAPRRAEWEGTGPARSRARIRYELRPEGEDRTVFDYTNEFNPPGGALGRMASKVVVGAASEREANNSLRKLKALVEGTEN